MKRGDEVGVTDCADVPVRIGDQVFHSGIIYDVRWEDGAVILRRVVCERQWRDLDWLCRVAKYCTVMPK